ncbi:hypothetical protein CLOBOL_05861 [Enterocloster bolteae ATCC BAA-613]|uniref:Uncharacterized protein n=1 Tax=Enterocloster bolteae (strain ATCC BAA-613 / DSM 15670 / CCUG 46953 / JCM 12243 / WAL 16351) TaxID=411902 RepID=A8S161_ENTBW|nr:hypothetical protein CLOBOL_05861 [Enterocloster bolteae ATCC BAA-613]
MRFYREERCWAGIYQAERYGQGYIIQSDIRQNLSGEGED